MSRLRADTLVNYSGSGTPNFKSGVTGAAVTFTGDVTAANGSFTGNVTIGGTLSYQDVTNIDSVGIITAQQGIQVSANGVTVSGVGTFNNPITVAGIATINGGGLDVTGVITATSFTGDGSSLSGVSPSVSGIASGTLANGQTVILQTDGTVAGVGTTSESLGSIVSFDTGNTRRHNAVFDPDTNQVALAYALGDPGYVVMGSISENTVTYGTPAEFNSGNTQHIGVTYDTTNNKVIVAFQDSGDSNKGKAIVGTVTGTAVTFGSEQQFESGNTQLTSVVFDDSNDKIVITYQDSGNSSYGKSIVGTVSGTSISFGSEVTWNSASTSYITSTFDSTNKKVVIAYSDPYGSGAYMKVGTVSGTSVSFGSSVRYNTSEGQFNNGKPMIYVPSIDKVLIAYRDTGNSNYGTIIAGTVSGNSISFGSETVFETSNIYDPSLAYNTQTNNIVVAYRDAGDNDYCKYSVGTISGTTITMGTPVTASTDSISATNATYDSFNNRVLLQWAKDDSPQRGDSKVLRNEGTNLTSSNFLGFSNAAYTDGQTATIQIAGAVDDAQSGLTTASVHYVQTDGTLSTTAGTPSVEAGLALSATEIAIKA
jgi:hypothetical protein